MDALTIPELAAEYPGLREWARDRFVGNECDTDEYGETQPAKGLGMAADLVQRLQDAGAEDLYEVVAATARWLEAAATGGRYDGADELQRVLMRYFEVLWNAGEHPYWTTDEEIRDMLADYREEMEDSDV